MLQSRVEICCCSVFLCRKFLLRPAPSIWYISLLVGSLTHDDGSPLFQWLKTQPPTRFFWPKTEEDCKTHFQLQVHQVSHSFVPRRALAAVFISAPSELLQLIEHPNIFLSTKKRNTKPGTSQHNKVKRNGLQQIHLPCKLKLNEGNQPIQL